MGDAWAGKTSLLIEAVLTASEDVDVICYFISRREADADSSRFLAAVVPQLASLLDEDPPAADIHEFRALWQRAVDRADTEGRDLLLVVDGLDEDLRPSGLPSVAALLPAGAGGRAHVLVSSRPHPQLPADVPAGHPLRRARPVPVQPFSGAQELAVLAQQEIDDLLRHDDDGLAADVLGLFTAAAGPLAVRDLAALTLAAPQSAALTGRIRGLLTTSAARSLQTASTPGRDHYQFAHESLLAYAQADNQLNDPDFRRRIHQWAEGWQVKGWPIPSDEEKGTPRYLLDTYPSTLTQDSQLLAKLTSDIRWIEAAITSAGVDRVLAHVRQAVAANPASTAVATVFAAVTGQAHNLRPTQPLHQSGYILRQLWLQAAELAEDDLARDISILLQARPGSYLFPRWTTRRASRALSGELGRLDDWVLAVAVLPDGRVVTGGRDGRVLLWDPAHPGTALAELGRHRGDVEAVAMLPDGRVVSGGRDRRVLVWDPAHPGTAPVELGRHDDRVLAVAALPDGRVVTGGDDWDRRVLVWDPAHPGTAPVELGRHKGFVRAMAALPDGRVVTGGDNRQVLVWDPAHPGTAPAELGRHQSTVWVLALLPDGRVITGGLDGRMLVWDPAHPGTAQVELGRHKGFLWAMAVLPDGRVVTSGDNRRVVVWDPARPGTAPAELGRHDDRVNAVAVLPDGRVVTGGEDRRVLVWDPARPRTTPAESGRRNDRVNAVAVLPDGRVITGGLDGRVLVWDPARPGTAPLKLGRGKKTVWVAAVLPDGRVITNGANGQVITSGTKWNCSLLVWDPARPGTPPVKLGRRHDVVDAVAVLPDGRVVTSGYEKRVLLWDPARPGAAPVELGRHPGTVTAVAVLPDGRVVTGGYEECVLLWDLARPGAAPVELGRHDGRVLAVAVLPDGRVVTGGLDGQVLVWDPAHPGSAPAELGGHHDRVEAAAVLPDGRVATGGLDGRVFVWDPTGADNRPVQLNCSVTALAAAPRPAWSDLVFAHKGGGFSLWSLKDNPQEILLGATAGRTRVGPRIRETWHCSTAAAGHLECHRLGLARLTHIGR